MIKKTKPKFEKAKTGLKKIPVAIISLVLGTFFLTFLALFIRKKGKKGKK
jgi:hypothetical protein